MRKLFGLAMIPFVLASTMSVAMAEQQMNHNRQTTTPPQQVQRTETRTTPSTMRTMAASDIQSNPMWMQGYSHMVSKHYPEATTSFQNLLSTEPNNVHALNGLAQALYFQGRYNEAFQYISRAVNLDPVNSQLFYTKAMILDAQDKPLEAVEAYWTFTSLTPDDGAALLAHRRAEELYKRLQPNLSESARNYLQGLRMLSLHQPEKAIPFFERYQALEPNNPQAHILLGRTFLEWGQPEKAIPYFENVVRTNANNPVPYYQLGSIYEMRGETQNAQNAWRKFLQFAPQSQSATIINRRFEYRQQ